MLSPGSAADTQCSVGGCSPPLPAAGSGEGKGCASGTEAADAERRCLPPALLPAPTARHRAPKRALPFHRLQPLGSPRGSGHLQHLSLRELPPCRHVATVSTKQSCSNSPLPPGCLHPSSLQPHLLPRRSRTPAIPHRPRLREPCQACSCLGRPCL